MAMAGMATAGAAMAGWDIGRVGLMAAMWWVMMVAMMLPSAAPVMLLHARTVRHGQRRGRMPAGPVPTVWFLAGYLLVWLGFALAAVALQWALERIGALSGAQFWSQSRWLSAGVLALAALYQISPLKRMCLAHCRAPAEYLAAHWRPGASGALRMGIGHGVFCVGCCWALMALLFVGGVMNVVWIAALTGIVLAEKLLPAGVAVGRVAAGVLAVWAAATLLV
jgi:predicted metal-binding membrane protein